MYRNKSQNGLNNICGEKIKHYREKLPDRPSQKVFAEMLQIVGLDIDKNAVQRMECGKRFVTDIELCTLVKVLKCSYEDLLDK